LLGTMRFPNVGQAFLPAVAPAGRNACPTSQS
jgi:hypothetical protein